MPTAQESAIADEFERWRGHLTGLAYRMLGSIAAAEDIVQEAYLRWRRADRSGVDNPRAFLSKIVTRLCLDEMKSARAQREAYIGPWLPEPVLEETAFSAESASEYAHDLSVGLMLALERLSPLERAAFLLHDIFDLGYAEVAELIERKEATCRQLAARARANVRAARPRFETPADGGAAIAEAFLSAARSGDVSALARLLAEDAVLHADGGGKRRAAPRVIAGREPVIAAVMAAARTVLPLLVEARYARLNGSPGIIAAFRDGGVQTTALQIEGGLITAIYIVVNPDKLGHIARNAQANGKENAP